MHLLTTYMAYDTHNVATFKLYVLLYHVIAMPVTCISPSIVRLCKGGTIVRQAQQELSRV